MSKSRVNKKTKRRLELKAKHAQSVDAMARITEFAKSLERQAQLDAWLISMEDIERRKQLYEYIRPFLRFDSVFPSIMTPNRIILP